MKRILHIVSVFLLIVVPIAAQTVKELESQRQKLLDEVAMTNKMLDETQQSKNNSASKLALLRKNIASRKVMIDNLNLQMAVLDQNLDTLRNKSVRLQQQLAALKSEYARLLQETQIRRNYASPLIFLFSASSFDQAYRRFRYLQESSAYRKKQALEIEAIQQKLADQQVALSKTRRQKEKTKTEKEDESNQLKQEQQKENQTLTTLQKQEKTLRTQLSKQQKQVSELNRRVEQAIAEEIRRAEARKKAQQEREAASRRAAEKKKAASKTTSKKTGEPVKSAEKTPTPTESVDKLTKEETLLSNNFESNKGRLPWPVDKGFISQHYGVQPHPVLKYVTINNKGVYLQSPKGTSARAIFNGTVTQIFAIDGTNSTVMVQHGNYRTVYGNLTSLYVKVGDHVSAKQPLGKIFVDNENGGKTELYFMIWYNKTILNPEEWIAK